MNPSGKEAKVLDLRLVLIERYQNETTQRLLRHKGKVINQVIRQPGQKCITDKHVYLTYKNKCIQESREWTEDQAG